MIRRAFFTPLVFALLASAHGQWQLKEAHTTADLRGIHSLGNGIAWASGTGGTVLHTTDDGRNWQHCTTPPKAEHLDFRGIQAFDANTAIVMSSGKGDLSRLYKTTNGCQSWALVFTNPDPDGLWEALLLNRFDNDGYLLGDPVNGRFRYWQSEDKGTTWQNTFESAAYKRLEWTGLDAAPGESIFSASNSALFVDERFVVGFVTGGSQSRVFLNEDVDTPENFKAVRIPLGDGLNSSGGFSVGVREYEALIAVGGDYRRPNDPKGTAAYSNDGGQHWMISKTLPHGYRSAVAYDEATKIWITVGPNGTDISNDDGRNWHSVSLNPKDTPKADRDWNAVSLPFVVGPHGRIGQLDRKTLNQ